MRKHTEAEVLGMIKLIENALADLLVDLGRTQESAELVAEKLVIEKRKEINIILDMPHGGSLSPEEIAEIILAQKLYSNSGQFTEQAAAAIL